MKIQKKTFYNSILGFFVKNGKKGKAKNLLDETFTIVRKKTKRSLSVTMTLFFFRLKTLVEVKKLSTRKRSYSVPFIISSKRRVYLIFKWLKSAVVADKRKIALSKKLSEEILKVVENNPSIALDSKKENFTQASKNRSNLYYRW